MTFGKRSRVSRIFGDMGWVFCLGLVIGLAVGIPALYLMQQGWQLYSQGVQVQGKVEDLWQTRDNCGKDNTETCTHYHARYSYDAGGPLRTDATTVGRGFHDGLHQGGPVLVTYLRGDPAVNEVESGWTLFGGMLLLVFALIFGGVGFGALWYRVRQVLRGERLRHSGVERQAIVTAVQPTNVTVNGQRQFRIVWRDETGATGQSRGRSVAGLPGTGTTITVFADMAGLLNAVWEGDVGSRQAGPTSASIAP